MTTQAAEAVEVGCYDLRGPDFETTLVSQLTGSIGDADRMIRRGSRRDDPWHNGFPNFAMYRTFLAGDTHLSQMVSDWCIAFAIAYAHDKGLKTGDRDLAGLCAGQDCYRYLLEQRWEHGVSVADAIGVTPKTYRRFRDLVLKRNQASLREYWLRLQFAMLQVRIAENAADAPTPVVRLSDGRGFEHDVDFVGDGNYRAMPRGSGC